MPKISIEYEVEDAQEILSTTETLVNRISWVLENKPPSKPNELRLLELRLAQLARISLTTRIALNERAKANVVNINK
jgi:hypothetical protein